MPQASTGELWIFEDQTGKQGEKRELWLYLPNEKNNRNMVATATDNVFWRKQLIHEYLPWVSIKVRVVSGKLLHSDACTVEPPYGELLKVKTLPTEWSVPRWKQWCLQKCWGNWRAALSVWDMESTPETPALIFLFSSKRGANSGRQCRWATVPGGRREWNTS